MHLATQPKPARDVTSAPKEGGRSQASQAHRSYSRAFWGNSSTIAVSQPESNLELLCFQKADGMGMVVSPITQPWPGIGRPGFKHWLHQLCVTMNQPLWGLSLPVCPNLGWALRWGVSELTRSQSFSTRVPHRTTEQRKVCVHFLISPSTILNA